MSDPAQAIESEDPDLDALLVGFVDLVRAREKHAYYAYSHVYKRIFETCTRKHELLTASQKSSLNSNLNLNLSELKDDDFMRIMDTFYYKKSVLEPVHAVNLIKMASNLLCDMPNIRECELSASLGDECIIVGDLHGSLGDFYNLVREFGVPGSKYVFVFTGNCVNHLELLVLVSYAFLQRPTRVFVNRGSHEHVSSRFKRDLVKKYAQFGHTVFSMALGLFDSLPLATILSNAYTRIFIVSGGISDSTNIDYMQNCLKRHELLAKDALFWAK